MPGQVLVVRVEARCRAAWVLKAHLLLTKLSSLWAFDNDDALDTL